MNSILNNTIVGADFASENVRILIGAVLVIVIVTAGIQLVRTIRRNAKKAAGTYAAVGAVGTGTATNFQNIPENVAQFFAS